MHAVSAGETIAAAPLIERLLKAGHQVVVSNMTPAGKQQVERLLGSSVTQIYAPYDLPDVMRRFLRRIKPRMLIVLDTELWPNMLHYSAAVGSLPILVNGRLSNKSSKGYARISWLTEPMLNDFHKICVQTRAQGDRFLALGLPAQALSVTGSIKFDVSHAADMQVRADALKARFFGRRIFLAASTHKGEEAVILDSLQQLGTDDLLILAPRHPHRADGILKLARSRGLTVTRHSQHDTYQAGTSVYILDTMGELMYFYAIADLAFVGGSMVNIGGHSPMEPASLGVPMLMGQYRRNIDDIAHQFITAGAMRILTEPASLTGLWRQLMSKPDERARMSQAGLRVMAQNKGALDRIDKIIRRALESQSAT